MSYDETRLLHLLNAVGDSLDAGCLNAAHVGMLVAECKRQTEELISTRESLRLARDQIAIASSISTLL